jgi:hypothetical protein
MTNEIKIATGTIEGGNPEIEISLKSIELNDVELILKGIEILIDSIDLDQDPNYDTMSQILHTVADRIGFNGWYNVSSEFNIKYDEDSEGYVSNREKRILLRQYIENEERIEMDRANNK